ncbi:MAG: N-methylhydantoinase [Solirubrobacteraceae bacterium]|nr:N-methylhydantoinase [Solirubrobacteraceae bacterium]
MDAVGLRVLSGALRAACEEMGAVLVKAAHSANIKERRDCSCALFDGDGAMVMQAEHIPVHLGAMPAAVAAIAAERADGDDRPWVVNDPFAGGTHLPDITVVTPVLHEDALIGFAASRAHHADVGGPTPGSMPADSKTLEDEGVIIGPRPLTDDAIDELVEQMRNPAQRRADLRAQLAANRTGATRLQELADRFGADELRDATDEVQDYAERRMRACIEDLGDGERTARDVLEGAEGDIELCLTATVDGDELTLDFTGSAEQHDGNLNCPLAVTVSACLFAVRVLTDPDIPASAGASRPLNVIAPEGTLLNARSPAAVVAGNVETSSRVADLVLAAFGRALGQGTMNNVVLGTDDFTYYETLGGGQGACPDADGPSAVHVAMSNTLNTPIEALELEFTLRVTEYAIRRDSGGDGAHRGGDGVVREYEALTDMELSLLTERRRHAPPGADGGADGAPGRNLLDGEELAPKARATLRKGSRLRLETPGGGGHGSPG